MHTPFSRPPAPAPPAPPTHRAAESVFDHSSHYEYLMEAAWEAVEQLHKVGSFDDYPESIASQMVRGGGGSCTRLAALMTTRSPSRHRW